jgi:hypothetical protein
MDALELFNIQNYALEQRQPTRGPKACGHLSSFLRTFYIKLFKNVALDEPF